MNRVDRRLSKVGLLAVMVSVTASVVGCGTDVYGGTKAGGVPLAEIRTIALPEKERSPMGELVVPMLAHLDSVNAGVALAPEWDDGAVDTAREADIAAQVAEGVYDFALIPARAFDRWPDASLPALSTPFVLHSLDQAQSVADDPAIGSYLERLERAGLIGVALIPENIRHPAALEGLVAPEEFSGLRVRTVQRDATFEASVLRELGAAEVGAAEGDALLNGEVDAVETSFSWLPTIAGRLTVTGDLDLWVKFDVLVANPAVWATLSEVQRDAVRAAAAAAARHAPGESQAAEHACALGHRVVVAGPVARAAFAERTTGVVRALLANPDHASVVSAMQQAAREAPAEFELPDLCRPPTGDAARPDD